MHITTDRLILRDFVADDWSAVLAYQRNPRYLRFYPLTDRTEDDVRTFVQMFLDQQAEEPRRKFQLAITLPEDGRLIGNCGVRRKPDNNPEGDIGYELDPEFWGRGYATEAAGAMALALISLGEHYAVDVLAGIAVAPAAWFAAEHLTEPTNARSATEEG